MDKLIEDLGDALKEVKASPQGAGGDMVALYGESTSLISSGCQYVRVGLEIASSLISGGLN